MALLDKYLEQEFSNPSPVSGKTLQWIIGILALLLPTILIFGANVLDDCRLLQNSISAYYHTIMRDGFVGIICAVSIGMLAYYGYHKIDNIVANIAAVSALGVAFFPTCVREPYTDCIKDEVVCTYGTWHYMSALVLFLALAFFCFFLFTRGDTVNPNKIWRNRIYIGCGIVILICIAGIGLYHLVLVGNSLILDKSRPVFWLEAIALGAFGISWLTKGGLIFPD